MYECVWRILMGIRVAGRRTVGQTGSSPRSNSASGQLRQVVRCHFKIHEFLCSSLALALALALWLVVCRSSSSGSGSLSNRIPHTEGAAACLHSIYVAKSGSSHTPRQAKLSFSHSPFVHLKRNLTSLFPLSKRHLLAAHGMQLKLLYLCYFIIEYFLA